MKSNKQSGLLKSIIVIVILLLWIIHETWLDLFEILTQFY